MSFRSFARALFAVLFLVVTYLTITPNPDETEMGMALTRWLAALIFGDGAFGDKVAHFIAYAALGASAALAHVKIGGRAVYAVAALVLYGAALEGVQGLMGVRVPEFADALANGLGAAAGFPSAALLMARLAPQVVR
jgi:hypothetical protein